MKKWRIEIDGGCGMGLVFMAASFWASNLWYAGFCFGMGFAMAVAYCPVPLLPARIAQSLFNRPKGP